MKKSVLKEYAKLIATVGANVQKGQEVIITAGLDQPEFVTMLTEACYKAGAKKVRVDWRYDPLTKIHAKNQRQNVLCTVEEWEKAQLQHMVDVLPARIFLESSDPDGLKGIPVAKYAKATAARSAVVKPYRNAIDNKHQWCIAAVPGEKWAKKVFPHLSKKQAVEALWDAILTVARTKGDAVENWRQHNDNLLTRSAHLNELNIRKVHFYAPNGTDLTIGLMEQSIFDGAMAVTLDGVRYNPNMPTEEVYTTPKKGEAEGIVYATMPLSYQGQLIDKFWMKFEGGKVVEFGAETGEEVLKQMLSADENAGYLGEVALVPVDSPISQSGLLFYSTLFDENASCHLALGMGYDNCVKDYDKYTKEELTQLGVNDSLIHVDFMVGCSDMSIDGITADGEAVAIFRNGTWAF